MIVEELILYSNKLELDRRFYTDTLGCELLKSSDVQFTVKIGISHLTFRKLDDEYKYHYCFLIPSNQLDSAIKWLRKRLSIIEIEEGRVIQRFESWNADAIYFYDGSGNVAEFIARHDLPNETKTEFDVSSIICINEIALPTKDIRDTNQQLEREIKTNFWKGDFERFGTNGNQNGLFLLPNYAKNSNWFPTELEIKPSPLIATVSNSDEVYRIIYANEALEIESVKN